MGWAACSKSKGKQTADLRMPRPLHQSAAVICKVLPLRATYLPFRYLLASVHMALGVKLTRQITTEGPPIMGHGSHLFSGHFLVVSGSQGLVWAQRPSRLGSQAL